MAPIECYIGFPSIWCGFARPSNKHYPKYVYEGNLACSLFEPGGGLIQDSGRADLDALRTFAEQSVGIEAQGMFLTKDTLMSESIHERGGGLCSISSKRIDMENMALDMLYLCDMVIGSGWDMPTHERYV